VLSVPYFVGFKIMPDHYFSLLRDPLIKIIYNIIIAIVSHRSGQEGHYFLPGRRKYYFEFRHICAILSYYFSLSHARDSCSVRVVHYVQ
jgi:hypothetical protein